MELVEKVRQICKEKGIAISKIERELGYGNGYFNPKKLKNITSDRLIEIANYLNVSVNELLGFSEEQQGYYLNEETAEIAQEIFENKELRLLFDAARNATPEDLTTVHTMLSALKAKERGETDEPS